MFASMFLWKFLNFLTISRCFTGYTDASNCSQCSTGYWGAPNCLPCPACVHGTCTSDGQCACSTGWGGELCNRCAETYYGPNCLPTPAVVSIFPSGSNDVGGVLVTAFGHNLPTSGTYTCRFGSKTVNATLVSENRVRCDANPSNSAGDVNFSLLLNGTSLLNPNSIKFSYLRKD